METGTAPVAISLDGDVLFAVLDRPASHNAIDSGMVAGLEALLDLAGRERPKVVVIRGAGGTFCSGADLGEVLRLLDRPAELRAFMARLGDCLDRIESAPWVSLAVIEGFALAGGCELLLACDLSLATEDARIGDRHAEYGLAPAAGGSVRLSDALPAALARGLLLGGEMISGTEAARIGLVGRAVAASVLEVELAASVERLRTRGRGSLATMKAMLEPTSSQARRERLDRELDLFIAHARSAEMRSGLEAFAAGRPGVFG